MKHTKLISKLAIGALAIGTAASVNASTMNFVASSVATSMDPQFHISDPNLKTNAMVYEPLVYHKRDGKNGLAGRLATSWKQLSGDKLEVNLRKGVKFHDGSDFTANDVVYSVCRLTRVKSASSYAYKATSWKDIEVVNDHKIIIHKDGVAPRMLMFMPDISIVSDSIVGSPKIKYNEGKCDGFKNVSTEGFNTGKFAIGTGPYKFKEFVKNQSVTVVKNSNYWGTDPNGNNPATFDTFKISAIKNKGARLAALLAGDIDVAEAPSPNDLGRLRDNPNFKVIVNKPMRSIFIRMSQLKDEPTITGTNGKNPFRDLRVRQAMSLAINRELIADRVMGELGVPATNISVPGFMGVSGKNHYEYNPEKAKKLLAEAGYPNGFGIVFGSPNDRYINDARVAQALAQMWSRIGIKVDLVTTTKSIFFDKMDARRNYTVALSGWAPSDRGVASIIGAFAGHDKDKDRGGDNPGDYTNDEIERLLDLAENTAESQKRHEVLMQAADNVHKNMVMFAVHFERFPLAVSKDVEYNPPHGGERTYMRYFKRVK